MSYDVFLEGMNSALIKNVPHAFGSHTPDDRCSGCTRPALGLSASICEASAEHDDKAWQSAVIAGCCEPFSLLELSLSDAAWLRCCLGAQGRSAGAERGKPAGGGAEAAGVLAPAPAIQRLKAECPSAHGHPASAASAPVWPAGSASGLHSPSLTSAHPLFACLTAKAVRQGQMEIFNNCFIVRGPHGSWNV